MPLPLTVSCFSKIQIGFTFLVPAHPGSPRQRAVKRVCVCVCCYCWDLLSLEIANNSGGLQISYAKHWFPLTLSCILALLCIFLKLTRLLIVYSFSGLCMLLLLFLWLWSVCVTFPFQVLYTGQWPGQTVYAVQCITNLKF